MLDIRHAWTKLAPFNKHLSIFLRQDYFTSGRVQPPEDPQQNLILTYSREENGVTTLRFYRKRDTNDTQNDVVIQVKRLVISSLIAFSDTFQTLLASDDCSCSFSSSLRKVNFYFLCLYCLPSAARRVNFSDLGIPFYKRRAIRPVYEAYFARLFERHAYSCSYTHTRSVSCDCNEFVKFL